MSLETIRSRVRLELQDQADTFQAQAVSDGVSNLIDLPVSVVEPTGLQVIAGSTTLVRDVNYSVTPKEGELILLGAVPPAGTVFTVAGVHYRFFTNAELDQFINTVALQHNHNQNPPVVLDEPVPEGSVLLPGVEEYLVALLAMIEALWVIATDLSYDIDIMVPEGAVITRSQRLRQVREIIAARTEEYLKLAGQLNVGLGRIEMFTLRRVSRTTNRLIPIYQPQEWDDRTPPKRLYPRIDKGA